jgi:hypothetical protein
MNNEERKKLQEQYASRCVIGGVYAVRHIQNGKRLLFSTTDMPGSINRFNFAQQIGGCIHPKLRGEWGKNGSSFAFEAIEELEKKDTQSDSEFKQDVDALFDMTREKYAPDQLY